MSTTFTDFLRDEAAKRTGEIAQRKNIIEDWGTSLKGLYTTIRDWLRISDPDGILTVAEEMCELTSYLQ